MALVKRSSSVSNVFCALQKEVQCCDSLGVASLLLRGGLSFVTGEGRKVGCLDVCDVQI